MIKEENTWINIWYFGRLYLFVRYTPCSKGSNSVSLMTDKVTAFVSSKSDDMLQGNIAAFIWWPCLVNSPTTNQLYCLRWLLTSRHELHHEKPDSKRISGEPPWDLFWDPQSEECPLLIQTRLLLHWYFTGSGITPHFVCLLASFPSAGCLQLDFEHRN